MNIITGKIIKIFDEKVITDKFTKRAILLLTDEQYPQKIVIEFQNKKTKLFGKKYHVDSTVEICIDIKGSESGGKYFNYIVGHDIRFKNQEQISLEDKLINLIKTGRKIEILKTGEKQYDIFLDGDVIRCYEHELEPKKLLIILKTLENQINL